jgi:outer membrane protein assembly factor BamC
MAEMGLILRAAPAAGAGVNSTMPSAPPREATCPQAEGRGQDILHRPQRLSSYDMTIRNTFTPAATRGLVLSALMVSLSGCGMLGSVIESDKVDYRAAKKAAPLDVPPDLTQLQKDNRYAIPDGRGVATASGFQQQKGSSAPAASGAPIGVADSAAVKVERNGNQRWLLVRQSPEQLWPQLKQFWSDSGFTVVTESATTGVMETDWAEDRSKIPQDFVRRSIGRVFDSAYSSGLRDKFRTRLERNPDGSTRSTPATAASKKC